MITNVELDFLRESNNIEYEYDDLSLQDAILAWQFIKPKKQLQEKDILETHRLLMAHRTTIQDMQKGIYRTGPVWVGTREGRKYYALQGLMQNWCEDVNQSVREKVWLTDYAYDQRIREHHIRYEGIHPFFDGNGRTGRIFLNWERMRAGLEILILRASERQDYYQWFK